MLGCVETAYQRHRSPKLKDREVEIITATYSENIVGINLEAQER